MLKVMTTGGVRHMMLDQTGWRGLPVVMLTRSLVAGRLCSTAGLSNRRPGLCSPEAACTALLSPLVKSLWCSTRCDVLLSPSA